MRTLCLTAFFCHVLLVAGEFENLEEAIKLLLQFKQAERQSSRKYMLSTTGG
jgi:hypothetical protein